VSQLRGGFDDGDEEKFRAIAKTKAGSGAIADTPLLKI
jgi:hypothetical protein